MEVNLTQKMGAAVNRFDLSTTSNILEALIELYLLNDDIKHRYVNANSSETLVILLEYSGIATLLTGGYFKK